MSKFQTLCDLHTSNIKLHRDYEWSCQQLTEKIINRFIQYLGIPGAQSEKYLKPFPLSKINSDLNSHYTIPDSIEFNHSDGLWYFGILLIIRETITTVVPVENIVIHLKFRPDKNNKSFHVSFGTDTFEILFRSPEETVNIQIDPLIECIFNYLKNDYENFMVDSYSLATEKPRVVGFR